MEKQQFQQKKRENRIKLVTIELTKLQDLIYDFEFKIKKL